MHRKKWQLTLGQSWGYFLEYLQAGVNCTSKPLVRTISSNWAQATPKLWVWSFLVKWRGTMAVIDSLLNGSKWNPCLRYLCKQLVTQQVNMGKRILCSHVKNPIKPVSRKKTHPNPTTEQHWNSCLATAVFAGLGRRCGNTISSNCTKNFQMMQEQREMLLLGPGQTSHTGLWTGTASFIVKKATAY